MDKIGSISKANKANLVVWKTIETIKVKNTKDDCLNVIARKFRNQEISFLSGKTKPIFCIRDEGDTWVKVEIMFRRPNMQDNELRKCKRYPFTYMRRYFPREYFSIFGLIVIHEDIGYARVEYRIAKLDGRFLRYLALEKLLLISQFFFIALICPICAGIRYSTNEVLSWLLLVSLVGVFAAGIAIPLEYPYFRYYLRPYFQDFPRNTFDQIIKELEPYSSDASTE